MMLNMFYGGRMKGMPPKLVSDNGKHVVIRPLAYVPEKDTARWAQYQNSPSFLGEPCGSQDGLQRVVIGEMLREWEKKFPGRIESMFRAMGNIVTTHMMDPLLHDFKVQRPPALLTRTATWRLTMKSCQLWLPQIRRLAGGTTVLIGLLNLNGTHKSKQRPIQWAFVVSERYHHEPAQHFIPLAWHRRPGRQPPC